MAATKQFTVVLSLWVVREHVFPAAGKFEPV